MEKRTMCLLLLMALCTAVQQGMSNVFPPIQLPARLADGAHHCEGRVEVFFNDSWGTVCQDFWDQANVEVLCRQLGSIGCGDAVEPRFDAAFGPGVGPIWLDNVDCFGNESFVSDCPRNAIGDQNCAHSEDASAVCQYTPPPNTTTTMTTSNTTNTSSSTTTPSPTTTSSNMTTPSTTLPVRLADGAHHCEGRVEVFYNDTWGTVCHDLFAKPNAEVVCRQLVSVGCGDAVEERVGAAFGPGAGPIWLDNVICFGNELSIFDCRQNAIGDHNCAHTEDVSVVCQYTPPTTATTPDATTNTSTTTTNSTTTNTSSSTTTPSPTTTSSNMTTPSTTLPVRLADGAHHCEGRVEVFFKNTWGTVCQDFFDKPNAEVVCRQLVSVGCGDAVEPRFDAAYGPGAGQIWMDNVDCFGNESSIFDCPQNTMGDNNCAHSEDASVVCQYTPPTTTTTPAVTASAALVKKCCKLRYRKLAFVLFHRPGKDKFNDFLKLFLKYAWLYRRYARLRGRFWRHRGLMRRIVRKLKAMYRALRKISRKWIRCRPLRKLGRKVIQGGKFLHRFLLKQWNLVLKRKPNRYEEPLTDFCRKTQDTARSACPGFGLESCWWFSDLSAQFPPQPNQTTAASPASVPTPTPASSLITTPCSEFRMFRINGKMTKICQPILRCVKRGRKLVHCNINPNGPELIECDRVTVFGKPKFQCLKNHKLKKFAKNRRCFWGAVGSGVVPLSVICPV